MKFYPRAKDLPISYTGCQIAWLQHQGGWLKFSTRYYSSGLLRAFYGPEMKGQRQIVCVFQDGKLDANSTRGCPSFAEASKPAPSVAPGCITKPSVKNIDCSRYE